jgi:cytochrome c oxidase subunit 2
LTALAGVADTRDQYYRVFDVYWPIGVGVFVVIMVLLAVVLIRFRSSSTEFPEGKDHSRAEELYALGVGGVVVLLLVVTYTTMGNLGGIQPTAEGYTRTRPEGSEYVRVTAARWNWRFDYPDHGVSEVGGNGRPATLVVPVDTPVYFRETSLDVIHSFWVPERRFKVDAFPGRWTTFVLRWPKEGFQREGGECNQYCGLLHDSMDFNIDVMSRAGYRQWLRLRGGS